ncbi:hypothetical protein C8Q77DRAFT_1028 [Trametes polyzona]|nr:hypothetical protein C8Q77DRAFT_1028 [Trametes polyzona]
MSTAHVSLDDYAFPSSKPHSSYELSYALGAPQPPPLYPLPGSDASTAGPHPQAHFHHLPPDAAHSAYLPDHPESFMSGYYVGMGYPHFGAQLPPFDMAQRPPSPRPVYTANPRWGVPEGYGAPADPIASSSTFLSNLQNVIDSSHTSQVQQHNAHQAQASSQQAPGPSSSTWTLSGSLDPATGVFQRSIEHPRLRTAQACEKCRIRKAKCSGDHPTCQRCLSRGLQCEYAPERKMRGPNKQKRKSISQKHAEPEPTDERRNSIASVSSTISSSSDTSAFDAPAGDASIAVPPAHGGRAHTRPSSRASPMQQSPLRTEAPRPRSTTIALGAIKRAAEFSPSAQRVSGSPPGRQRPPPLDLSGTRHFPQRYPNMLAQYTRGGEPLGAYGPASVPGLDADEARRTSLPSYLVESYSRVAYAQGEQPQTLPVGPTYDPSVFAPQTSPTSASASAESSGMARYVPSYSPHC